MYINHIHMYVKSYLHSNGFDSGVSVLAIKIIQLILLFFFYIVNVDGGIENKTTF